MRETPRRALLKPSGRVSSSWRRGAICSRFRRDPQMDLHHFFILPKCTNSLNHSLSRIHIPKHGTYNGWPTPSAPPPSFLFHTCTELNQNCRLPATGRHPSEHCTHNKARFLGLLASKHKSETVAHGKKSFLQTIGVSFSVMNVHIAQRQASLDIKSTFSLKQRAHSRYTNENISLTDPIVRLLATR